MSVIIVIILLIILFPHPCPRLCNPAINLAAVIRLRSLSVIDKAGKVV